MLLGYTSKENDFTNAVRLGTLGHAYLFFGDSGIGKRTFAHSLANFLENGTFVVPEKTLLDTQVFLPNEKGIFSVDKAREVKKFLSQYPLRSSRRMVIVDDSEALTEEAQASLLKIVEEPPSTGLIVFIASHEEIFFRPLLSRLTRIYFPRMSSLELMSALKSLYGTDEKKAIVVARKAFGSVGNAHALLFPKAEEKETDFGDELEQIIISLWKKGVREHSGALTKLLQKEEVWKRFNLNGPLQKKSVSYIMQTRI